MKIKIIFFLLFSIIFVPAISRAMSVPIENVNIIVNAQGNDHNFNFNLKQRVQVYDEDNDTYVWAWQDYENFTLQTQDLTASKILSLNGFIDYSISEDTISGFKIDNISCTSDNPADVFQYQPNSVNILASSWSNINCTFNNVQVLTKTPVLIVPGLMGTNLQTGNTLLWADVARMMNPLNSDNFMDSLQLNSDLIPIDSNVETGDLIMSPIITQHFYDLLVQEFKNQGYVEGEDLFTFPYDWRYGVSGKYADGSDNADLLAKKIQDILTQTGADKVDIVAHSLGGLIVKEYVVNHPTDNHIGKAVFVGVPNTGAVKAVKALVQGDNFGVLGLNDQEMKKIAENMPAAYDLLPDQQYYNNAGSFVSLIDNTAGNPMSASSISEDTKVTDLNYSQFKSFLTDKHLLNSQALANAENLHTQNFDNFDLRTAGIDLYAIDGCKTGTIAKFDESTTKNILGQTKTSYSSVWFNTGDGTVSIESSTNLPIDQSKKYYALVSDHGKMPSQDGIRQEIVNLISGSNLSTGNNLITQDISQCQLNGKAISVFSPVNIFVTDQNGNRLGLADDGSVINEIPNASFEVMGEHKFIYLPQDSGETYKISLTGTGDGTFTIKSQDIQNSQPLKMEVFSDLPVTSQLTGQVNLSGSGTTLSLNGSSDPILPSATLDAEASADLIPPVSTITLDNAVVQQDSYKGDVSVNIKSTDDLSGILNVEYNLDDTSYKKVLGDTTTFTVSGEGKHTITFFATDKAGNNEPEQTIDFKIENPPAQPNVSSESVTPQRQLALGGGNILVKPSNNPSPVVISQPVVAQNGITEIKVIPQITVNEKPIIKKAADNPNQPQKVLATRKTLPAKKEQIIPEGNSKSLEVAALSAKPGLLNYFKNWFNYILKKVF